MPIKKANLIETNYVFEKLRKNGVFGVFQELQENASLYSSDDAQTCRIAAQLDVRGVPIIKKANLIRNKLRFGPKNVEKRFFLGFPIKLQENASQFYCIHPMTLKLTGLLPSWM